MGDVNGEDDKHSNGGCDEGEGCHISFLLRPNDTTTHQEHH
jgi:hypothetical protein